MRRFFSVLIIVVALAAALWYFLMDQEIPVPPSSHLRTIEPAAIAAKVEPYLERRYAIAKQHVEDLIAPIREDVSTTLPDKIDPATKQDNETSIDLTPQGTATPEPTQPGVVALRRYAIAKQYVENLIAPIWEDVSTTLPDKIDPATKQDNETSNDLTPQGTATPEPTPPDVVALRRVENLIEPIREDVSTILPDEIDHTTKQDNETLIDLTPQGTVTRKPTPPGVIALGSEAKQYVEKLTEPTQLPIPIQKADHFVTRQRVLSLIPENAIERVLLRTLIDDQTFDAGAPITIVREVEQIESITLEQLVAESRGDLNMPVRIVVGDEVELSTVGAVLKRFSNEPEQMISSIRHVRHLEITTLAELIETETDIDAPLNIIKLPYGTEAMTLDELLQGREVDPAATISFIHTVLDTDTQGIWGIIHSGITEKFAHGFEIPRSPESKKYAVHIPEQADEVLHDRSSSFLGRLIDRKTRESFVYNYSEDRMGRNPDRIYPGQELVIVNFAPEELIAIYEHFNS